MNENPNFEVFVPKNYDITYNNQFWPYSSFFYQFYMWYTLPFFILYVLDVAALVYTFKF